MSISHSQFREFVEPIPGSVSISSRRNWNMKGEGCPLSAVRCPLRERGTILLFALMIMASIIVTATGLTAVIISSLQQSRTIDNSIVAYYAAESGIEEAIFQLRKDAIMPDSVSSDSSLGNGASWQRTVSSSEPVVYAGTLPQDSFVEIALYDPDQPTNATNVAQVTINWSDSCLGCSVLQASLVGWQSGGPIVWDPNAASYLYTGGTASLSALPGRLYRVRLIARKAQVENLQIRTTGPSPDYLPLNVPGRVKVAATGKYANVNQRLTVSMSRETPLSGLYDFVIFSECSLVKGGTVTCP